MTFGILSILPPLLAIILAIRTKQVIFSLLLGLFCGGLLISDGNPLSAFFYLNNSLIEVFQSAGNTRTVLFTLLIGALIQLIRKAGGVEAFVVWIQNRLSTSSKPRITLQLGAALTGFFIFIESNISILTVGTAFRPLFDRYQIAREKLAYLADSSSAPSCILFPINAWGAYIMGLLASYEYLDPLKALFWSIPFNFYPILTLLLVGYLIISGKGFGPMKKAEQNSNENSQPMENATNEKPSRAFNMTLPLLVMIVSMPLFLVQTGWDSRTGDSLGSQLWSSIGNGSGSSAVLYAVVTAIICASLLFGFQRLITLKSFFEESLSGMKDMLVMAILMVLAFAVGNVCKELGTGIYIANVAKQWLSPELAPALVFLTSCVMAFATGTSWGTFAIMIPIGLPIAEVMALNPYLIIGAVLGGGVFGDHCSPLSDTTLISSMAAGTQHVEHVRTQLPYALLSGAIATFFYLIAGFIWS